MTTTFWIVYLKGYGDKQTNRQTDKQTNRQTDNKQTDKRTNTLVFSCCPPRVHWSIKARVTHFPHRGWCELQRPGDPPSSSFSQAPWITPFLGMPSFPIYPPKPQFTHSKKKIQLVFFQVLRSTFGFVFLTIFPQCGVDVHPCAAWASGLPPCTTPVLRLYLCSISKIWSAAFVQIG